MLETPHSLLQRLAISPVDAAAWERFVRLYTPFMQRWSRRLGNLSDSDVDDVVQEILVVVVNKMPTFQHNQRHGAFRSWLKTILVNVHRAHLRKRIPTASEATLATLDDPASKLSLSFDEEHNAHVVKCLVELAAENFSPETMKLFRQVVLEGIPNAEVARQNGVTVNVVNLAKSRILNWLRREGRGLKGDDGI